MDQDWVPPSQNWILYPRSQVYDWLIGQRCMVGADSVCFTDAVGGDGRMAAAQLGVQTKW